MKIRRLLGALLAVCLLMGNPVHAQPPDPSPAFDDVDPNSYYSQSVYWAVEQGITKGTAPDTFSPNAACTNAQILTFLWRASGAPVSDSPCPFPDIPASSPYEPALRWAGEKSLLSDTAADADCTRAMAVTYIWKAAGSPEPTAAAPFTDVPADSELALAAAWAVEYGVTKGTTDSTFDPTALCTRAQIVTFLWRAFAEEASEPLDTDSSFSIHFIDVGQADAALVECDNHYLLIDGGNKADSSILYTVLKNEGVNHLDMVVGTHAHEDHIGGLPGAFQYAAADITLCPVTSYDSDAFRDFQKYANEKGGGLTVPAVGSSYQLGSAEIKVLGVNSADDTNNTSIVLKLQYGSTSFLFTGDAEREAEEVLLQSGADLSATVLKVGHHGSDTSTTYPFLRAVMPTYAVISAGAGNSYGHPTENTLSRLRDAEVQFYRTDLQGDIYCKSDGQTVTFTTAKTASESAMMTSGEGIVVPAKPSAETTPSAETVPSAPSTPSTGTAPSTPSTPSIPVTPTPGNGPMVWIPESGKKYHNNPNCSNMEHPTQVTQSEAEALGYTPCKRCYG